MAGTALKIVGILAVLIGLVWMGQGSGTFPYPSSSFMIAQPKWIAYGAVLAIVGIALTFMGRKRRR